MPTGVCVTIGGTQALSYTCYVIADDCHDHGFMPTVFHVIGYYKKTCAMWVQLFYGCAGILCLMKWCWQFMTMEIANQVTRQNF
jgi:hypothetical protein